MNLPCRIGELSNTVPLNLKNGPVTVNSTSYTDVDTPHWILIGPAMLSLSGEDAIALGNTLIQAEHHRRAVLAQHQAAGDAGEAVSG